MNRISIKSMDGILEEVDLINAFKINDINKNFVILSKGEKVAEGMSKIYISEFVENEPGVYSLVGIKDDQLWSRVKEAMKLIVESSENTDGSGSGMSSLIQKVLVGLVTVTGDYVNSKKIIGVNDDNITPDEKGICPLGKQYAFLQDESEKFDKVEDDEVGALDKLEESKDVETLDFGSPAPVDVIDKPETEGPRFLQPAVVDDVINSPEAPIEVAPTDAFTTFNPGGNLSLEVMTEPPTEEQKIELDLLKPEEVVAEEPTKIDIGLFDKPAESVLEEASGIKLDEPVNNQEKIEETDNVSDIVEAASGLPIEKISSILDGYANDIYNYAKQRKEEIIKELSGDNNAGETEKKDEIQIESQIPTEQKDESSDIMIDAMRQIQGIQSP